MPQGTPNLLIHEKSPYLLQHAYNPVQWYPWGEAAFQKARAEYKPIFLSIGYSTCHWCHVMEHESFENEQVAAFLNQHFVSIKVDREERPDVDAIYMAAVQAISGGGGWPMTVFLTTELKPFFAGTYFPPQPAYGRPSFLQLLTRIVELWNTQRKELEQSGDSLTAAIAGMNDRNQAAQETTLNESFLQSTFNYFAQAFDREEGGFGNAPKFPRPVQFDFLFNYFVQIGNAQARDMALVTLRKMALGGMHDQLGGGFHRYSVDRYWRVSHFEKMLYDQAQLVHSYLDAFQITKDTFYSSIAKDIIGYVLRDMTHPEGGFFSAEDADSEGKEGTFYVWRSAEIEALLGNDTAQIFNYYYGITPQGNFEHGSNVLHTSHSLEETAQTFKRNISEVALLLSEAKATLFDVRSKRIRPHLDDKILTSWNGLMIGAIARAGEVLGEPSFVQAAERAGEFIWKHLRDEKGNLLHRWRDGEARFAAYLDSYAFLIKGYLELYEATFNAEWLTRAHQLQREQDETLYDKIRGGYYMSRPSSDILVRSKGEYDGAEPSGNSVSVLNLLKLHHLTEEDIFRKKADATLKLFINRVGEHPYAMPEMMVGLRWYLDGVTQVVLTGDEGDEIAAMKKALSARYLPSTIALRAAKDLMPSYLATFEHSNQATAFVCKNFACELPVHSAKELEVLLDSPAKH